MQHSAAESYAASTYPPLPRIADSDNIASMVCREWPAFGEQPAIIDGTTGTTRTYAELTAGVDALREKVEAEQEALRQKRMEREARRLRRQLELAEANQELPPEPPPPQQQHEAALRSRGRQYSDVI